MKVATIGQTDVRNELCTIMEHEKIQVECRSGYKVNEYPLAFVFQDERLEVSEILDRWYEGGLDPQKPVIDYFRVKTDDGRNFILWRSFCWPMWSFMERHIARRQCAMTSLGVLMQKLGLSSNIQVPLAGPVPSPSSYPPADRAQQWAGS